MGFSGQEYWGGFSCPPPGDLPDPGIEPVSLMSPALAGGSFTTRATEFKVLAETSHHISWNHAAWGFSNPMVM